MINKKQERYLYLDVLRALASFAVVIMHCTDRVFTVDADLHWWTAMGLQAVSHWAIPVFFMITGITLLNYRGRYSTKEFLKKRVLRILFPFLAWSGIYLAWRVFLGEIILESPRQVICMLTMNEINGVFWFFYVLLGLYLCIPILSLVVNKEKVSVLYYFVLIWLVNVVVLPMLERFVGIPVLQGSGGFTIGIAVAYVGYLVLGWLLHHIEISRKQQGVIYLLGLFSLIWMMVGTYLLNGKGAGGLDDFFMGYMSIDCILLSIAVVVFFKNVPWDCILKSDGKLEKVIRALARASFGVYLLQMLVIQVLQMLLPIDPFSYRYMTVRAVLVYGACVGITLVGQRIPGVRRLFP